MSQHPPQPCPKCGKASAFHDCMSVDIGVGLQEWDHEYACPEHGVWARIDGGFGFRDLEEDVLDADVFRPAKL